MSNSLSLETRSVNLLSALKDIVGPAHLITAPDQCQTYLTDWSGEVGDQPLAVIRPKTTEDISRILALCHEHRCAVIPQGGLTGLAGGATVRDQALVMSMERLKGIIELDTDSATLTVWAGTALETIQNAANEAGYEFALDLGARGSCQIGGNVATNAGGNRVIRYGMTRDLILGLEVVQADGTVLSMLNKMAKNNAAFDLKHLFIGSEGTLGVISKVVLRLHPQVTGANTALVALPNFEAVISLLRYAQQALSGLVSAFEVMWQDYYQIATTVGGSRAPISAEHPLYVLMDMQSADPKASAQQFEAVLEHAFNEGWLVDAAIAQSHSDAEDFWILRDAVAEILPHYAPTINFDISFPISKMGEGVDKLRQSLTDFDQDHHLTAMFFGHVGDGNIHVLVGPIPNGDKEIEHAIEKRFYEITQNLDGSISAEHGIGLHKKPWLSYSRTEAEIALMRTLKQALDPHHILNPGKVFDL